MTTQAPLIIAEQGYVFAGGHYVEYDGKKILTGQLYAEYQIPEDRRCAYPVIMVHGGSQSGTNYTGTPDSREGWAQHFLRRGYAVYVVDQVGRGRAAYRPEVQGPIRHPDIEGAQQRFVDIKKQKRWPQAAKHTQWPGGTEPGDPVFDQFFASQVPTIVDFHQQQLLNRDALIALIDKIGPSILLTHSQSGAFGWPIADARPDAVKALIQAEPSGPTFHDVGLEFIGGPDGYKLGAKARPYGLCSVPLTYDPPLSSPNDLVAVREAEAAGPELARGWYQQEPARKLPNLMKMPILVVTAEASYHAYSDHLTAGFLEQAGVKPTFIRLEDAGIHGNGHMLQLEKNNHEISTLMMDWLEEVLP